jgi:S1-C subfamily serine protease
MTSFAKQRAALIVSGVMLVVFGFVFGTLFTPHAVTSAQSAQPVSFDTLSLSEQEQTFANLYAQVAPSVVSINVVARQPGMSTFSDEEGFAFGSGSGFVIDTAGHIVTNNHVVDGATSIEVNFFDGTIARGEIIGLDPDSDIALLQVDLPAEQLRPATFADSDQLVVGQTAIAIGSPFGEEWTLTTGIVSALNRTIQGLTNFSIGQVIQTDAAINPGNSGGPLLNLQGQVIGVNSQIVSQSRSNSGIGFAVPSNLVQRVVAELIEDGQVDYSYLGISGSEVSLALQTALNLPNNLQGVVVGTVERGAPAAAGGLRNAGGETVIDGQNVPTSADIITAINGERITGMPSLVAYLASNTRPGDTVNLTVWRDGAEISLPVTLASRP